MPRTPATAAASATLYIVKMPTSPRPYSATTTLFGYRKLADAVAQVERTSAWMRPDLEIYSVAVSCLCEDVMDAVVGAAPGLSVLTAEVVKRFKGGNN